MHIVKVVFVELQIDHVERREFKEAAKKDILGGWLTT